MWDNYFFSLPRGEGIKNCVKNTFYNIFYVKLYHWQLWQCSQSDTYIEWFLNTFFEIFEEKSLKNGFGSYLMFLELVQKWLFKKTIFAQLHMP